jgi:hypothetical protein
MDPANDAPASTNLRNTALVFLGVLALISLIAAVVAANTPGRRKVGASGDPSKPPTAAATTPAPPSASITVAGSGQGAGYTGDQPAGSARPQVVYFRLKQQPECRPGRSVPAIVEWKVSGATGATLSADKTGKVGSYPGATGSRSLEFACSGTPGSTEKHTYTLATDGGSPQCTQTLTASATVAAKPSMPPSAPPSKAPPSAGANQANAAGADTADAKY